MPHLTPSKCSPEQHSSTSSMFSVINTVRVKPLIIPSPYPIPGAVLHPHFDTHLIRPNKGFPILNSKVSVECISQPWHSLAPSLGAKGQGSWISWQQVYSAVDSHSIEARSTRISRSHRWN